MNFKFFFFFLPLTLVFLVILVAAAIYLLMGLYMFHIGYKENDGTKTSGGSLAIFLSIAILIGAAWAYSEFVWSW
jgi:heme/copper-type cytochrome/quinol oxidase subunit 4